MMSNHRNGTRNGRSRGQKSPWLILQEKLENYERMSMRRQEDLTVGREPDPDDLVTALHDLSEVVALCVCLLDEALTTVDWQLRCEHAALERQIEAERIAAINRQFQAEHIDAVKIQRSIADAVNGLQLSAAENIAPTSDDEQSSQPPPPPPPPTFGRLFLDHMQIGTHFESLATAEHQGIFFTQLLTMMLEDRWCESYCWLELNPICQTKVFFMVSWWNWVTADEKLECSPQLYSRTQILTGMLFSIYQKPPRRMLIINK
jgi:hypothetical protein